MNDDEVMAEVWPSVRPNQVALAEELCADLDRVAADPDDQASWQSARAATHRLAGNLGSFGQHAAGDAAVALEDLIGECEEVDVERISRARTLAEVLRTILHAG